MLQHVASDMEASAFHYQFSSNDAHRPFLVHETLPLQPLMIVNRGVPRPNDQKIRLRRAAHGRDHTLATLASDRMRYAIPAFSFEGNHFVLNVGELCKGLTCGDSTN
jgi:hypothetical protein